MPSDIAIENKFIHSDHLESQSHLDKLADWTRSKEMLLNNDKSKYMIFNFSKNYQFNTRLYLEDKLLEQVPETWLLEVIIKDDLSWHSNTANLCVRSYQRMLILKKLYSFHVPLEDLVKCTAFMLDQLQISQLWCGDLHLQKGWNMT